MSAEYSGKMDADKTLFVLPRPVERAQDRIRAMNLTGDETGVLPTDGGQAFQGLDWRRTLALEAGVISHFALEEAIDAAWY